MTKLTDLDPRLAGWDEATDHAPGTACELCGRSSEDCVLDVYNDFPGQRGNWYCDDCVCAQIERGPREVVMPPGHWRSYRHPY